MGAVAALGVLRLDGMQTMRRTTGVGLIIFFTMLSGFEMPGTVQAADRPNIIFFLVDDFGARDLACYGSTLHETPHMDRLAAEGMRFTDAYAAYPRCVPSRQAIFSGKYSCRVEVSRSGDDHPLPLGEVTFGEALQDAGYRTGYIGKWHLGDEGGGPGAQGFETVVHAGSAGATGSFFHPFTVEKGRSVVNPLRSREGDYLIDRMTDEAVSFVEQESEKPFLLVVSHYAVHTPLEAPAELTAKYERRLRSAGLAVGGEKDDADLTQDRQGMTKTLQNNPTYAAMVEKTDESLGRIMQCLTEADLAEDTILVLTSDHGGLSTRGLENRRPLATSNAPLRQGKGSIFEGGIRVPLIVKWPGRTDPGSVSAVQVNGTDHYPTILEMAGVALKPDQHVDGESYQEALNGEASQRAPIFCNKWMARPKSTGDTRAISLIDGRWKLILWLDDDLVELFDLGQDIGETRNVAGVEPERTQAMLEKLLATEQSIGSLREKGLEMTRRRMEKE
jgi:arylsulfatase A-like enzyme